MTNGAKCPPECDIQLKQLKDDITKLEGMDKTQWEVFDAKIHGLEVAVSERVRVRTLIALVGIVVSVILTLLGLTFTSLRTGQNDAAMLLLKNQEASASSLRVYQEKLDVKLDMVREAQIRVMSKIGLVDSGDP